MTKGAILLLAALGGLLGFVVWAFFKMWAVAGDVRISVHGYIAMGLAVGFIALLGGGLMWLAFYSSRKGFDDRIERDDV